jgi:hypothetical protein
LLEFSGFEQLGLMQKDIGVTQSKSEVYKYFTDLKLEVKKYYVYFIFGWDLIVYSGLQGIYSGALDSGRDSMADRQFWL